MPTRPATSAASGPIAPRIVYASAAAKRSSDVPIVLGGIEAACAASRTTTTGQDKVRRSILVDAKCDLLLYGNAERAIVEIAHRLAAKEPVHEITDVRGTAFMQRSTPEGWFQIDSTEVDQPGPGRRAHQSVPDHVRAGASAGRDLLARGRLAAPWETAA